MFRPPVPLRIVLLSRVTEKDCAPKPIVTLVVTIPAPTSTLTGASDPLVMVKVAFSFSIVATKTVSDSRFTPLGAESVSFVHVTSLGVGRYQYTSSSVSMVGLSSPALYALMYGLNRSRQASCGNPLAHSDDPSSECASEYGPI